MDSENESTCIAHEPCPECGSKDNLGRYSDGHGFCFGCGHYEKGESDNADRIKITPKDKPGLISGEVSALAKRGITEETCRKWNYQIGHMNGKPVQIANYGRPAVAQKIRFANKDFLFLGDTKAAGLYGQHLWRDGGKMLVITEGEIDALTVSQLQGNKWPVVSVPSGAKGAAKAVSKAIQWVEKFEKVVIMFDDDEPGRSAATEVATLLTPGKAHIATIDGYKDANEALQAGDGAKVIDAIWGAKEYRPDGVVDVDSLAEAASAPVTLGIEWPWPSLTAKTYGIRSKELYAFGGGTGIGKSDLFKDVALHLVGLGHRVGLIFLEEPPAHTLKMLAGKASGKRFHVPGVDVDPGEIMAAIKPLRDKVFFYDHFGASDYEVIKDKMRYMVTALGCKHIFLDHLTALAANMDEDERKAIDKLMADLASLAQQLDFTLYFISHLATPEGKPHEEGGRVMERHFRGSRSIGFWSHFMFGIERNKQEVDGITTFRVLKDRYTGDSAGHTFGLRYDREKGRSYECDLPKEGGGHGFKDESGEF